MSARGKRKSAALRVKERLVRTRVRMTGVHVEGSGDLRPILNVLRDAFDLDGLLTPTVPVEREQPKEVQAVVVSSRTIDPPRLASRERCLVCGHYHGGQGNCITAHALVRPEQCPTCLQGGS